MDDHYYMSFALNMARMVQGQTSPNPPVAAIVVNHGEIVGLGAHLKAGEAHAEVYALKMAGEKAVGATIYITLEPCSHEGRTAPCVEAIIAKGIKRVVIAMLDPNKKNDIHSIHKLKQAGITVDVGVMEEEAKQLNRAFCHFITNKKPFVTVKTAVTLDGKTATESGESKWITGEEARKDVHVYRSSQDAVLVGVNTVIHDNPLLTTRLEAGGKNPIRIILDTHLRIPVPSNVLTNGEAETWIFTGNQIDATKREELESYKHVRIFPLDKAEVTVDSVLNRLGEQGIMTLFVEGGSEVHGSFLKEKLVDECVFYMAPKLLGGKQAYTAIGGTGFSFMEDAWEVEVKEIVLIGDDIKITAVPKKEDEDVHRNY